MATTAAATGEGQAPVSVAVGDFSSSKMIQDGWFGESETMWPGQQMRLKVKEVLHEEFTGLQHCLIFDSETYGRVLVLDGVIQLTERDEAAYQEMITHLPIMAHHCPERVLIVGGGDGGVLREVCRHAGVKQVVQCEIDRRVIELAKEFFSKQVATSFGDERLELLYQDAAAYVKEHPACFDVIIVDSSDPVGPAESLYTSEFYSSLHGALRPGGIVCTQGECQWLHLELICKVMTDAAALFDTVDYAWTTVPTYPSGQIGFIVCRKEGEGAELHSLRAPQRPVAEAVAGQLQYYSPAVHAASFVLPAFAERALAAALPGRR